MINVNLDRRVRVHEGRKGSAINAPRRKVHWRGTLAEFWDRHSYMTLAEIRRLDQVLADGGSQNLGGFPTMLAYVIQPDA